MLLVQPVILSNWTISEQSTESLYYNISLAGSRYTTKGVASSCPVKGSRLYYVAEPTDTKF